MRLVLRGKKMAICKCQITRNFMKFSNNVIFLGEEEKRDLFCGFKFVARDFNSNSLVMLF